MTPRSTHDRRVLIVGMGPTGAALAGLLGQRGIRVEVFDKNPSLHPLPRAIGMDHEVMRIAQELAIHDELQHDIGAYKPSEYRGVDGAVIKRLDSPPPPFRSGWEPMFVFNQPAFETTLRRRLEDLEAVKVSCETEVLDFGQDESGAWVDVLRRGASGPERITGDYLVACDGGASQVREALGIELTDLGFHESWLVVDVIVDDDEVLARLPQTQVQYCEPERPATFVHLLGRHRRWEIALNPGELPVGPVESDAVWPWLERWVQPGEATIWRAAAYMFHGLVAQEWRRGRIFLAGDAAHMTPPFMAQGMAQGMRDAQNVAWKLAYVLDGRAAPSLLSTYEPERRQHVLTTTRHTIELGRVICERDVDVARARDRELLGAHDGEVPVTLRSNFLPNLVDGLVDRSTSGGGEILPQPFVRWGGERRRLDDLVGRDVVVISGATLTPEERGRLTAALAPLPGRVVSVVADADGAAGGPDELVECDGVLRTWLSGLGATIAVGRPDRYVYGTASSVDHAELMIRDLVAVVRDAESA